MKLLEINIIINHYDSHNIHFAAESRTGPASVNSRVDILVSFVWWTSNCLVCKLVLVSWLPGVVRK
jgi:hypothetical protein